MNQETDYRLVTLPGLGQVRIPAGMSEAEVLAMLAAAETDPGGDED